MNSNLKCRTCYQLGRPEEHCIDFQNGECKMCLNLEDESTKVALFIVVTWVAMLPLALYQLCELLVGLALLVK